jgi:putative membrane protein
MLCIAQETMMTAPLKFRFVALLLGGHPSVVLAQTPTDQVGCMGAFWGGGWGHMFFGGFMMLFFWAGFIALIAVAVRWVTSGSAGNNQLSTSARTPRQILDERFARGDIDKDEFEERKKALAS